jgi:hypothetical protein
VAIVAGDGDEADGEPVVRDVDATFVVGEVDATVVVGEGDATLPAVLCVQATTNNATSAPAAAGLTSSRTRTAAGGYAAPLLGVPIDLAFRAGRDEGVS